MSEGKTGVRFIENAGEKEQIAEQILKNLPEWFGQAESTKEYIEKSRELPFFAYGVSNRYVGFIVLKETGKYTAEIFVMGVLKEYHRQKIGTELFREFFKYAEQKHYEFIQVKTVEEGHYEEYDRTRLFYEHLGFRKLECFPTLWDEWNPCLVLVMAVKDKAGEKDEPFKVSLSKVDGANFNAVLALQVSEEQKRFVPSPEGILARAWAYRDSGSALYAVYAGKQVIGLVLVYHLEEEPCCYFLMEMMIDKQYQNRGYGQQALKEIICIYKKNPKYPIMELAVDRENAAAIHMYTKVGFVDSGYTDLELPQYVNLVYDLTAKEDR